MSSHATDLVSRRNILILPNGSIVPIRMEMLLIVWLGMSCFLNNHRKSQGEPLTIRHSNYGTLLERSNMSAAIAVSDLERRDTIGQTFPGITVIRRQPLDLERATLQW